MDLFPHWRAFRDAVVIHDETEFILPLKPVQQQLLPTNWQIYSRLHHRNLQKPVALVLSIMFYNQGNDHKKQFTAALLNPAPWSCFR